MINSFTRTILTMLLGAISLLSAAQNTIVLQNTPFDAATIQKITFNSTVTPPLLIAHSADGQAAVPLVDNTAIPFFSGLDLTGTIYEAPLTNQTWTLYYLTPIGYFYSAPLNALLDEAEQSADETRQAWLYKSFDTLDWALITTDESLLSTENLEYPEGDFILSYSTPEIVETLHILSDGSLRESELTYSAEAINPDAYTSSLLRMIYGLTETLATYEPQSSEAHFSQLIEKFKSLLPLPVVQGSVSEPFSTLGAVKFAKKKVTDRRYTIYPVTGPASDIYDGYVGRVEGRLNCASNEYQKDGEYGIVYATRAEDCVVGKGTCVKARQENLKLTFTTELENLQPGTTYYYRTYAKINKADKDKYSFKYEYADSLTGYGKIRQFKTAKYCYPKITWWMLDNPYWIFNTTGTDINKSHCIHRMGSNKFTYSSEKHSFEEYLAIEGEEPEHYCQAKISECTIKCRSQTIEMAGTLSLAFYSEGSTIQVMPGTIGCHYGCNMKDCDVAIFREVIVDSNKYRYRFDNSGQVSCSIHGKNQLTKWCFDNHGIEWGPDMTDISGKDIDAVPLKIGSPFDFHISEVKGYMHHYPHYHVFIDRYGNRHWEQASGMVFTESVCPFCRRKNHSEWIDVNFNLRLLIDLVPVF